MGVYHGDGKSRSLWIVTGSRESEGSGVNGDGERDAVAVVDDAVIAETVQELQVLRGNSSMTACPVNEKVTTSFGNFRP